MKITNVWMVFAVALLSAVVVRDIQGADPAPDWSEDMNGAPSATRWGKWTGHPNVNNRANGGFFNDIQSIDPGPSGYWRIGGGLGGGSSDAMAVIEFGNADLVDPATTFGAGGPVGGDWIKGPGPLYDKRDFTVEIRFRINEAFDSFAYNTVGYQSWPIGLKLEDNLHPAVIMEFGYYNKNVATSGLSPGSPEWNRNIYNMRTTVDNDNNWGAYNEAPNPSQNGALDVGTWHTVRIVSDYEGSGTQARTSADPNIATQCLSPNSRGSFKFYLDGSLINKPNNDVVSGNMGYDRNVDPGAPPTAGNSFDYARAFHCLGGAANTDDPPGGATTIDGLGKARRSRGFTFGHGTNTGGGRNRQARNGHRLHQRLVPTAPVEYGMCREPER